MAIIAIDFDGTVVTHDFPYMGRDIGAQSVLKKLVEKGHKLILHTMRSDNKKEINIGDGIVINGGNFLKEAIEWFERNEIPLYSVNRNPTQHIWTTSPKTYANLFIDDAALGAPLKFDKEISDRPFMDWVRVEEELIKIGYL